MAISGSMFPDQMMIMTMCSNPEKRRRRMRKIAARKTYSEMKRKMKKKISLFLPS
jgi:hypothetical protein